MAKIPLWETASVQADAYGNATIYLGPKTYGASWNIEYTSVSTTSDPTRTEKPALNVFRNVVSATTFMEGTSAANSDTSDSKYSLNSGEMLVFQFANAEVGAHCTVMVRGTMDTGR